MSRAAQAVSKGVGKLSGKQKGSARAAKKAAAAAPRRKAAATPSTNGRVVSSDVAGKLTGVEARGTTSIKLTFEQGHMSLIPSVAADRLTPARDALVSALRSTIRR